MLINILQYDWSTRAAAAHGLQIETLQFAFDDSRETFNFAEAALLIQGSACIYSKKVEFLYGLVYQVLDMLASKRQLAYKADADTDDAKDLLDKTEISVSDVMCI